jgi:hypothetical protein
MPCSPPLQRDCVWRDHPFRVASVPGGARPRAEAAPRGPSRRPRGAPAPVAQLVVRRPFDAASAARSRSESRPLAFMATPCWARGCSCCCAMRRPCLSEKPGRRGRGRLCSRDGKADDGFHGRRNAVRAPRRCEPATRMLTKVSVSTGVLMRLTVLLALQGGAARRCCSRVRSRRPTHHAGERICAAGRRGVLLFFFSLLLPYALGRDKVLITCFK